MDKATRYKLTVKTPSGDHYIETRTPIHHDIWIDGSHSSVEEIYSDFIANPAAHLASTKRMLAKILDRRIEGENHYKGWGGLPCIGAHSIRQHYLALKFFGATYPDSPDPLPVCLEVSEHLRNAIGGIERLQEIHGSGMAEAFWRGLSSLQRKNKKFDIGAEGAGRSMFSR